MKNEITITGKLFDTNPDHESHGKIIYRASLEYKRPSGTIDILPVFFDESVIVPKSEFCRIDGEVRERTATSITEDIIHAYAIVEANEKDYRNDVEIEGKIVRHGKIGYAKNVPFVSTIMQVTRANGIMDDYVKVAIFGSDAFEIVESGRGKTGYIKGRFLQSLGGTQVSARGITWR